MQPSVKQVPRETEDALAYLPRKSVAEYNRGQVIYDDARPSTGLYLVIQGRIKVSLTLEDGSQSVIGIFSVDDFFGESALLGLTNRQERATAMEYTRLMLWTSQEIMDQIERQPKLGMALMQKLVKRCLDFGERLQSLALDKTPQRVALNLLHFAERLGSPNGDGSVRIPPLTHQLLSEYMGTSREIVTFQMNHLRHQGFVRYSRKSIEIYTDALTDHLRKQPR